MLLLVLLALITAREVCSISLLQDVTEKWVNYTQLKPLMLREMENVTDNLEIYLKMFDASTKLPSGLLAGSFVDLGNFDECYDIHSNDIYGKYCLGIIPLSNEPVIPANINIPPEARAMFSLQRSGANRSHPANRIFGFGGYGIGFYWAICVPHTLKVEEVIPLPKFFEEHCYSKDQEPSLSTGAILTITTLAVFIGISLVSTAYDVYLHYTQKKSAHEMLVAFSYLTNGQKLLRTNNNPDHLVCLNGIRAISMMWVILGHIYSNALTAPLQNYFGINDFLNDPWNMIVNGATVSVDTFFAVGGLVTVYTFMNAIDKGHKFNIFTYYLHRFLRLTPAMGIGMMVYYNLTPYLGNGPLWSIATDTLVETCRKGWWSTLFYFANYYKEGTCVPQGWYLQVDMQLFLLSPLILIPLMHWRKVAYVELALSTVAGMVIPFCLGYFLDFKAPMGLQTRDSFDYYQATYARFGPYVIGMIAGLVIYQIRKRNTVKLNIWLVLILWIASLSLLAACLFAGFDFTSSPPGPAAQDPLANAFFFAFNRNGWALGVCLVIYLCVAGYGGPINLFLSNPVFQFLSKLSYSMYIVHFAVITIAFGASRTLIRFSNSRMMFDFWGYFMITLPISVVLCLTFESPILIIEKWIFGKGSKPKQEKQIENNEKV